MKQKLFINQLSGRWLAVVLALLLMPLGILGQITVAGISPDVNGDIKTSDIQGFDDGGDSYVAHYSDGVLTLQNVRLEGVNGLIEWSGDTDLTIEFSGTNSIDKQGYTTNVLTPIKSTTGHNLILRAANNSTNARLYFGCYDLEGTNDLSGVELISGFSQVVATGLITNDDNYTHSKTITYRVPPTSYNLWIGGVQVTSDNASNVLGHNGTPTVVFDAATSTLTLNGLSVNPEDDTPVPYITNGIENLTINLVGFNRVQGNNTYFLVKDGDSGEDNTVTFTTDADDPGSFEFYGENYSPWCTGHTMNWSNGLGWKKDNDSDYGDYVVISSTGLTVAGTPISNGPNIISDNTLLFDSETSTLTLNEVYLTVSEGDAIVSGLDDLTIFLVGENSITSYGNTTYAFSKSSEVSEATITFTTDATSNGSLTIAKLEQYLFGDGVTPVYDNVSIKHDGDNHTISSSCGISVGGVAVTEINKSDVLGNGKVSYNATTHTLTLNNATIAPNDEVAGISFEYDVDLTIALIGNNSIRGGEGCTAISKIYGVETPHLYFVKADANQHFSLNIIAQDENDLFERFTPDYGEDFFVTDEEDDGTFTRTISSTMFGGTGSAAEPFLIKTADDLKNFAINYNEGRFSNNVHIQLFNDINCEGEEGFTTIADNSDATFYGVFDGNNKTISNLTMTGAGLFGYVSKDNDFGVGTIQDLTLSGYHLTSNDYTGGGIVAELSEGAIVSNCTIVNSTIACAANQYNPVQGGIVGFLSGTSTVTGCVVNNVQVKAETTYTSGSGPLGIAGGIVGRADGGTISSCAVRNGSKITCYYADESAELDAGALVGKNSETTLSGNYYDYDVTVEMLNGTDTENKITKSGYTQRAIGGKVWNEQTQENEPTPDVAANNGAVMYTQVVTLPAETDQATVTAEENTYYSTVMISDALAYLVAPGQTVTLNANPGNGYAIASLTATNTTTSAAITTTPTPLEDGIKQYTFTMPDAPVSVAVTAVAAYGVSVAGIEVTELNYTDVLGDGKVSFTLPTMAVEPGAESTPATLTLNGATINGNVVSSLTTDLYIHLQGSNVINAGEKSAFVLTTAPSTQTLVFTTNATTPGQLLIKTSSNGYKENFSDAFGDGLTLAAASGKRLIGVGAELTPKDGLFWTDQQFTVSGPSGSTLYYKNNINSEETAYAEPFTLTADKYNMVGFRKVTVDETEFSLYGEGGAFIVHNKPGFSVVAGTYNEAQNVTLTGLPSNLGISNPEAETYPQVWYYLGENVNDSVNISSAEQAIAVSESTKVSVYILDQDSGKVFKSSTVEAEYVIRKSPDLRFYTSEQSYLSTGNTVNVEYGEEYASPVLKGKIGNEYTATLTDLGIVYNSSDEHVATISQTGQITIVGGGFTTITATSQQTDVYSADNTWFTLKVRPADPAVSLAEGAYYTGQELTLQRIGDSGTVYYSYGEKNVDERTVYQEAISLPKGCYDFYPYTRCGTDEQNIWSYGNAHRMMYVYDQPQISHASGTYDGSVEVEITNLPESGTYAATVYYYFDDDEDGAVPYEAGSKITITEDKTLKVYIYVEGDSAKNFKTAVIEREYVVRQDAGIAFVKNDEPVETADYTIGGATAQTLPTLQNENGLTVTYTSEDTDVATVNATTGAVTPVGVGVTSIIASWNATATLMAGQATYLLHVYKDLTHESITVTVANATFTGEAVEPEVTVMDGETDITGFVHLAFSNNVEVGTNATVTVTPNGQLETNYYTGSTSETFAINYRTLVVGEDVTFANGQKWASYYNQEETLNLPEGVMAYIVTAIGETAATVAPISYVPVNVPVLIEKDSETTTSNTSASGNLLQGAAEAVAVSSVEGTVYGLYNNKMMRVNKGTIPAGRAYLVSTSAAPARELTIGIDTATGIRFVEDGQSTTDQWYTIDGRKLQNKPTKNGLYIKNGKTVVVNNK